MNIYFICVIVCVQMWCMYAQLLNDQTQKDFWVFYLFLEVIFCHFGLESFSHFVKFFVLKNFVFGHFMIAFACGLESRNS